MPLSKKQYESIKQRWLKFLEDRLAKIQKLNLDGGDQNSLTPNPFMLRALKTLYNFDSPRAIITYLVESTLSSGNETAYGFAIQDTICSFPGVRKIENAEKKKFGREVDIGVKKGKIDMLIQVKAGPNTINKTMSVAISNDLKEIGEKTGHPTGFAMTYGSQERVSSFVKNAGFEKLLLGKEFWEYISGDPDCYLVIFEIIADAEAEFSNKHGSSLTEKKNLKIDELTQEFVQKYGKEDPIKSLIRFNF